MKCGRSMYLFYLTLVFFVVSVTGLNAQQFEPDPVNKITPEIIARLPLSTRTTFGQEKNADCPVVFASIIIEHNSVIFTAPPSEKVVNKFGYMFGVAKDKSSKIFKMFNNDKCVVELTAKVYFKKNSIMEEQAISNGWK